MLDKLIAIMSIADLRRKLLLTLALLAVYRMGFWIPLPIVNQERMQANLEKLQQGQFGSIGSILQTASLFSASQAGYNTIFGLGIMPYISCSIVFQLLATVYPPLERMQKEGESGRRKINEYTRQASVVVSFLQSLAWVFAMNNVAGEGSVLDGYNTLFFQVGTAVVMTSGTLFLMWIGEQIDAFGIGNGISLLIMAGIMAQMPGAVFELLKPALQDGVGIGSDSGLDRLFLLIALFVAIVLAVVFVTQAQRRVPIQSAKHARGRRMFGGSEHFLPLKLNQSGVMPIIFASSLLMIPGYLYHQLVERLDIPYLNQFSALPALYYLSYAGLIFFFSYFWAAVTFSPKDIAQNLKDYGSFIPGYRPGNRTADYLEQVVVRITFVGAAFLSLLAILPSLISKLVAIPALIAGFYGGTGLLIVVSVSIDLIQRIDSHLLVRNQAGLASE
ncbi:MAG: preprotein translocase subunit SecY [Planctomycetia bacterium]|nr:preprotein translocase subunit SecY [Planctomycetia bacterium]